MSRPRVRRFGYAVILLLLLALLVVPQWVAALQPDGLQAAWERARTAGSYHFTSDIVQVTTPSATIANVGKRSHEDRLRLEGQTDLRTHAMELQLWSQTGNVSQADTGLAVKVEGNKTWMRQGDAAWQPAGDLTGTAAPSGDFMTYLQAVKDVVAHEPETRAGRTFTRYSFNLDSVKFASNMRDQLEAAMSQRGELLPGMHLDVPGYYAKMTGSGELWVGTDGLPVRQRLSLQFPEQNNEAVSAEISVDFAQWGQPIITWLPASLSNTFFALAANPAPLLSVVLWVGVAVVLIRTHRSRRLQRTIPAFVIAALVIGPALTGQKANAIMAKQATQSAEQTENQTEAQLRQGLRDEQAQVTWDAHTNPLTKANSGQPDNRTTGQGADLQPSAGYPQQVNLQPAQELPPDNNTDSDGDGLTDYQEALIGTSSGANDDNKDGVADGRDSDDDGLNDNVEINGFAYNGRMWYTNPLDVDTNHDSTADTLEWHADADNNTIPDDTDGDGVPDLFDDDNDGDGVPDRQDLAPFVHSRQGANAQYLSETKPLTLSISGLQAGKFTYVDFQIRPKDPKHLWYAYNVLDWPEDRQGQVQDDDNATYADVAASDGRQASPNEAWGDMKLIPMLEIRMGNSNNNLPPQAELSPYNIATSQLTNDPNGFGRVAYVPLSLISDEQSGARVAFNGRMIYRPGASWGASQAVRVVWIVQALLDQCTQEDSGVCIQYGIHNEARGIQTYYDEWTLTGMHVREDHGVGMSTIYEDPAVDTNLNDDDSMWLLASGLDNSFLAGRDCDSRNNQGQCVGNGTRDVRLGDITTRFNHTTNGNVPIVQRWNIPNNLTVTQKHYEHLDLGIMTTSMTETKTILRDKFTPLYGANPNLKPLIMYAREEQYRALGMDAKSFDTGYVTFNGGALTLNMSPTGKVPTPLTTVTGLKWNAYCATAGTTPTWDACVQDVYWRSLDDRYSNLAPRSGETVNEARGRLVLAQLYYLSVSQGINAIVQQSNQVQKPGRAALDDSESAKVTLASLNISGPTLVTTLDNAFIEFSATNKTKVLTYLVDIVDNIKIGVNSANSTIKNFLQQKGLVKGTLIVAAVGIAVAGLAIGITYLIKYKLAGYDIAGQVANWSLRTLVFGITLYVGVIAPVKATIAAVRAAQAAAQASGTALSTSTAVKQALGKSVEALKISTKSALAVGAVIATAITWGFFIYSIVDSNTSAFSPEFNALFAETIAATILILLLTALSSSVVGLIIVGIIAVIDLILTAICELGVDDLKKVPGLGGACFTLSTSATKLIAMFLYAFDAMVDTDRKDFVVTGVLDTRLANPNRGFVGANSLTITLPVTTTLVHKDPVDENVYLIAPYMWLFDQDSLRSSTVKYTLSRNAQTLSASRDEMPSAWQNVREDHRWAASPMYRGQAGVKPSVSGVPLTIGLNQTTPFYLNMAYAVPAYECWGVPNILLVPPTIPVCYRRTIDGDNSTKLEKIKFDVLPNTLDEFMAVSSKGNGMWGLSWDAAFGGLHDADGDGLMSSGYGGSDINDNTWDADGDGLSDAFELDRRRAGVEFAPILPDTDKDGLTDRQEMEFGTVPSVADTDNDGLKDGDEVYHQKYIFNTNTGVVEPTNTWEGGWNVVITSTVRTTLTTRVSSDPTQRDTDSDGVPDSAERTLGRNPNVYTPNPVQVYVSTDDPDGIVGPNQAFNYITTVNSDTDVDPGVLQYTLSPALGGGSPRVTLPFAGRTETQQKPLTLVAGTTSGQIAITSTVRTRLPGPGGAGWQWNDPAAATINNVSNPRFTAATASRPDRQGNYLFNTLLSNSTNRGGTGDIRIDEVPSGANRTVESDGPFGNGQPTYLRGNTTPSIACNDSGVCMTVWDQFDNCNTVTLGQQTTVRTGDEANRWLELVLFFVSDNTDRTPRDGGYQSVWFSGQDSPLGPNNINQTLTFCGNGRLALYESDNVANVYNPTPTEWDTQMQFAGEYVLGGSNSFTTGNKVFGQNGYEIYIGITVPTKYLDTLGAALTNADGTARLSQFALTTAPTFATHDYHPQVATDGTNFLAVWDRETVTSNSCSPLPCSITTRTDMLARLYDSSGNALGSSQVVDTLDDVTRYSSIFQPRANLDVAWVGNRYRLAWKHYDQGEIRVRDLTPAPGGGLSVTGVTGGNTGQTPGSGNPQTYAEPSLAYDPVGDRTLLVYGRTYGGITGLLYTGTGAPQTLTFSTSGDSPRVAFYPLYRGWLVGWLDYYNGMEYHAYQANGTPLPTTGSAQRLSMPSNPALLNTGSALACPSPRSYPVAQYNFEELPGAITYADNTGRNNTATGGAGNANPFPGAQGADGSIGAPLSDYALEFDGVNDYATMPRVVTSDFSVALWINTTQVTGGETQWDNGMGIVSGDATGNTNDWGITLGNGKVLFGTGSSSGSTTIKSGNIADGQWHFVTATRQGSTLKLYLDDNVTPVAQTTSANAVTLNAPSDLRLGAQRSNTNFFRGKLDYLNVFPVALAGDAARAIYNRSAQSQAYCVGVAPSAADTSIRWTKLTMEQADTRGAGPLDASARLILTVDATIPTSTLTLQDGAYVQGVAGGQTLIIGGTAHDIGAGISKVEVSVNDGAWQTANGLASWAYALNVTQGAYTVRVRATDRAGNLGAPTTRTLIVDASAPTATVAAPSATSIPQRNRSGQWRVVLSGTTGDPAIGTQSGSGVAMDTLKVSLQTGRGAGEGNGWQTATVTAGTWWLDYLLPTELVDPTGTYAVALQVEDRVGNRFSDPDLAIIQLDTVGPGAVMRTSDAVRPVITSTLMLGGPISDTTSLDAMQIRYTPIAEVVALSGTVLLLPFDEPTNAVYFADHSTRQQSAVCSNAARCPIAAQAGRFDRALTVAADRTVTVPNHPSIDFGPDESFSLQTWIKTTASGRIITKATAQNVGYGLRLGANGAAALTASSMTLSGGADLRDNAWHHIVAVVDRTNATALLYVDGVLSTNQPMPPAVTNSADLVVGGIAGTVDQVAVWDRALLAQDVAALYASPAAITLNASLTQRGAGVTGSTWGATVPTGLEGQYQIDLRAVDLLGNRRLNANVWRGIIDTAAPRVVLTATPTGVSYFDTTTNQRMYEIAYTCVAQDRHLSDTALVCPNAPATLPTRGFADTSGLADLFPDLTVRDQLSLNYTSWEASTQPATVASSCDSYRNCSTSAPQVATGAGTPMAAARSTNEATMSAVTVQAATLPRAVIVSPLRGSYVGSSLPLNVTVAAESAQPLRQVTLSLDGRVVDTATWTQQANVTRAQRDVAVMVTGAGPYTLVAKATDWSGVVQTTLYPVVITVDDTPPALTLATTVLDEQSTLQEGSGVMRFNGTASDRNGLAAVQVSLGGATFADATFDGTKWSTALWLGEGAAGQNFVVTVRAIDVAGLISTVTRTLKVDVDAPPIDNPSAAPDTTITAGPSALVYSHRATFRFAGTDDATPAASLRFVCRVDGGGYVPCTSPYQVSGLKPGAHIFEVRAIDGQGQADATPAAHRWKSAAYPFTGFIAPLKNAPDLNVVQAGSTVPVKFSLGSIPGTAIFDPGSPSWRMVNCVTKAPVDGKETIAAGSLQYDAKGKQFNYTWKTDKTWPASCRQLVIRLADGRTQLANFKIKK